MKTNFTILNYPVAFNSSNSGPLIHLWVIDDYNSELPSLGVSCSAKDIENKRVEILRWTLNRLMTFFLEEKERYKAPLFILDGRISPFIDQDFLKSIEDQVS